jgi:hypothetical protein
MEVSFELKSVVEVLSLSMDFKRNTMYLTGVVKFFMPGSDALVYKQPFEQQVFNLNMAPELGEVISKCATWDALKKEQNGRPNA